MYWLEQLNGSTLVSGLSGLGVTGFMFCALVTPNVWGGDFFVEVLVLQVSLASRSCSQTKHERMLFMSNIEAT